MTGKKVIGSKNYFSKSCPEFYKLGGDFFPFDEISKIRLLQRKNDILIMYIMYIMNHASLALEPPKLTNILFFPEFEILFSTAQLEGGGCKNGRAKQFCGGCETKFSRT